MPAFLQLYGVPLFGLGQGSAAALHMRITLKISFKTGLQKMLVCSLPTSGFRLVTAKARQTVLIRLRESKKLIKNIESHKTVSFQGHSAGRPQCTENVLATADGARCPNAFLQHLRTFHKS